MPLIKGKSQKSFVKNLKTEMEHGKPQKQSLAIAYAMKRKAQKMAHGGESQQDPAPDDSTNSPAPAPTQSTKPEDYFSNRQPSGNVQLDPEKAKGIEAVFKADGGQIELDPDKVKAFKQGLGFADGGSVKGVHKSYYDDNEGGESRAGDHARHMDLGESHKAKALDEHNRVLGEMMAMKRPKLKGLAQGGQITDNYQPSGKPHVDREFSHEPAENASGFMDHEGNRQRPNSMAHSEDDKDLNQRPVDMQASTSMTEQDLVDRIMMKRSQDFSSEDRYSEGGRVANQDHGENNNELAGFSPNEFDDLVLRDDLESSYGDDDNSGDNLGNRQEDEDRKDIVARIMASRRKKDRLPSPA
jgi:hypothetical protein